MKRDLFDAGYKLPEKVTILAPGPNGRNSWDRISGYVIAVNKAITIKEVKTDMWCLWALAYRRYEIPWFLEACAETTAQKVFGSYQNKLGVGDLMDCDYTFPYRSGYPEHLPNLIQNQVIVGGTISMAALQIALWCGVKEVTLCGCDFFGAYYHDGTPGYYRGVPTAIPTKDNKVWSDVIVANHIIRQSKALGMKIRSISATALDVKVI
jgi:hypothetical protein